jgi:murein DD-endopeptidase MepM/ murein hydrolase activator NlpD
VSPKPRRRGRLIPAFIACFYAGVAVGWCVHAAFTPDRPSAAVESRPAATTGEKEVRPTSAPPLAGPSTATSGAASPIEEPIIGADPVAELRRRNLQLPIDDARVSAMEGDFGERRGGGSRGHEAVDILVPRHTPIRAVDDGTIARLFHSAAGGTTIYQFDPQGRYCYYYAHLERYADGLRDGMRVSKGDVIGFVGTTGNAPRDTPHLHFAIFKLTDQKRWWDGRPVDPYLVFRK